MSLEKIAQLNALAAQMEEMKKKAIGEIKDRTALRVQALKKIQEYLKELSEATKDCDWRAETNITIYWLVKQNEVGSRGCPEGVCFYFSKNGNVKICQYCSGASGINIDDFTTFDKFYRVSNGKIYWEDGMVELIDRWKEIKPYLEQSAEKAMIERMNKTQKELADFKASYEKVVNFEA